MPRPSPLPGFLKVGCCVAALLFISIASRCAASDLDPFKANATTAKLLAEVKEKQLKAAQDYKVFHDFQFSNQYQASGIRFEQRDVDDAAKTYKAAHYDHGTGMAVADVDGDGLLDVYFVNQLGESQLWRNLGKGKFENITAVAGVGLENRICVAASFADIDNDGLPDLFVTTVRTGNVLFKNLGHGKFEDISKSAGVAYVGHSSGAVFFDFNRDGLLDLFVANVGVYTANEKGRGGFYLALTDAFSGYTMAARSEQSILYQNLGGGKFKDVSKEMNLEHRGWSGDATVCNLNQDGFPDLYVLSMSGNDKYYENNGGKGFVEKTSTYFPKTPWGSMGVKFFDFNLDGLMDLYVTDMHSDMTGAQTRAGKRDFTPGFQKQKSEVWCSAEWTAEDFRRASNNILGNAFFVNKGTGVFAEVSDQIGTETYWPWGMTVADFNADGYEDLFVTAGMGYPFRYAPNSLLLNENGKRFVDSEYVVGVEPRAGNRLETEFFTLDCSGADKDHPLCYHKKGKITVPGSLSTRSSAAFDVDDDGDLDIITNDFFDHPQVLMSNLSEKKKIHYLKLKLVGTTSNRDALGATVKVISGARTYTRFNDGKSGYLSQSSMPFYFGLGDTAVVDRIEITWPSGVKQEITQGIELNKSMTVTEKR